MFLASVYYIYIYIDLNLEPSLYLWGFLSILLPAVECDCELYSMYRWGHFESFPTWKRHQNQTIWFVDNLGLAIRQVNGKHIFQAKPAATWRWALKGDCWKFLLKCDVDNVECLHKSKCIHKFKLIRYTVKLNAYIPSCCRKYIYRHGFRPWNSRLTCA